MAELTPLKKELGTDLNEMKTLIDERSAARDALQEQRRELGVQVDAIDAEIKQLRTRAQVVLGVKADNTEGKVLRERDKPKEEVAEEKV